jgi:hypothetical protein
VASAAIARSAKSGQNAANGSRVKSQQDLKVSLAAQNQRFYAIASA